MEPSCELDPLLDPCADLLRRPQIPSSPDFSPEFECAIKPLDLNSGSPKASEFLKPCLSNCVPYCDFSAEFAAIPTPAAASSPPAEPPAAAAKKRKRKQGVSKKGRSIEMVVRSLTVWTRLQRSGRSAANAAKAVGVPLTTLYEYLKECELGAKCHFNFELCRYRGIGALRAFLRGKSSKLSGQHI